ncbi:MAG TPA: hypothetical protein VMC09_03160 [Anaerolineales bacterium]|nr:hypothetical protein [Anaerolineales bacterium]
MRKATRIVALCLGILAGLAGLEHGYFETLQGSARPAGWMFPSWGPLQCDPAKVWHACEPAMSLVPNFLVTGILTILLSLVIVAWSVAFVQRRNGGWTLLVLALAQLLLGGGFFPPLIGIVGAAAGIQINKSFAKAPASVTRFAARLWPWPLVILTAWLLGQFPLGAIANDFMKSIVGWGLLLIVVTLPLSLWSASAHDAVKAAE